MSDESPVAPSAAELLANSIVQSALDEAWQDSQADDPQQRHEEGGWIYVELATNEIITVRAQSGDQAAIDLSRPPVVDGHMVVGKFHTILIPHPKDGILARADRIESSTSNMACLT